MISRWVSEVTLIDKTMIDTLWEIYKELKECEYEYDRSDMKDSVLHSHQGQKLCEELGEVDSNMYLVRRKDTEYNDLNKEGIDFSDSYYQSFKSLDSELFDKLDENVQGKYIL